MAVAICSHNAFCLALTESCFSLLMLFFMMKGYQWQNEIRIITESQKEDFFDPLIILITAFFTAYLLIGLSRKILRLSRRVSARVAKKTSEKASTTKTPSSD